MPSIDSKKIIVSHQVSVTHVPASSAGGDSHSDDIELVPRRGKERESDFQVQGGDGKSWGGQARAKGW